jgi:anti-sigma factor RsiW
MPIDDCGGISRLSAFLDGELSEDEREAVKAHLEACASCSEDLRRFKAADAGLRALPPVEPSPFFAARVAAAARALNEYHGPFRRFVLYPVPAAAALTAFIIFNIFTFAFNINALENGPRRELARKVVSQLARPASLINPVAVARLCGECSKYMCLCMHEAGKKSLCPCKDCEMDKAEAGGTMNMEGEHNVH